MEPWDGPASVAFTDGTVIGAVLDRNGLRPGRYWVTADGLVVMASEVGVLDIDPADIVGRGRLQPGRMFLVDTSQGRVVANDEIKTGLAAEQPYQPWLDEGLIELKDLPDRAHIRYRTPTCSAASSPSATPRRSSRSCWPPWPRPAPSLGSMGTDTPVAVLSDRPRLLFDYFAQLFAQVTNPPLDAIREELVTSLGGTIGSEQNLLDPRPASCRQIHLPRPVIHNDELAKLLHCAEGGDLPEFKAVVLHGLYPVSGGGEALAAALEDVCARSPTPSPTAPDHRALRPGLGPGRARRSPRCCSPPQCTTTSSARRPAPGWAWSSRPARPARCTTWRC